MQKNTFVAIIIVLILVGPIVYSWGFIPKDSGVIDSGEFNYSYGYNSTSQTFTNWDSLNYKVRSNGIIEVRRNQDILSYFGFALTGTVGGNNYIYTSEDFDWTWSHIQNGEEHIFIAYNNNLNFNWTQEYYFYSNKSMKIKHIMVNDLVNITNAKMWYVHTIEENEIIIFNSTEYELNLVQDKHFQGNFNEILPRIDIKSKYFFNYSDLIENNFDVTNIYLGNGSIIDKSSVHIMAIGFTKNNGNFFKGMKIEIDPTIETVESTGNVGRDNSIAIDSIGVAHISHLDYDNDDLRYCNNSGGSWSCMIIENGATGNLLGFSSSIAIDSSDVVHISHQNLSGKNLRYCNNSGGSWSCIGIEGGTSDDCGRWGSIAIDSSDVVHISHVNRTGASHLRYCNNSGGSWSCVNVVDYVNDGITSIAIDSSDVVHISYDRFAGDGGDLGYCNNSGGSWSCMIIDALNYAGDDNSIAIDSNDKIHISYQDITNDDLKYCENTGGSWVCSTLESAGDTGRYTSIGVGYNDIVHISFRNDTDLRYCNDSSGSWGCTLVDEEVGGASTAESRSLSVKKGVLSTSTSFTGFVHISYFDDTGNNLLYAEIDITSISTNITYPSNNSFLDSNESINLNFTIDNVASTDTCLFTTDNYATNTTITNCQNTTFNRSEGNYLLKLWINESAGKISESSVNFTIDNIKPLVSNISVSPTAGSQTISFSFNATDTHLDSCWYSVYNLTGGIDPSTTANTSVACNSAGNSETVSSYGTYTLEIYANDSAGNENSTTKNFTTSAIVPGLASVGGGGAPRDSANITLYVDICGGFRPMYEQNLILFKENVTKENFNKLMQSFLDFSLCISAQSIVPLSPVPEGEYNILSSSSYQELQASIQPFSNVTGIEEFIEAVREFFDTIIEESAGTVVPLEDNV